MGLPVSKANPSYHIEMDWQFFRVSIRESINSLKRKYSQSSEPTDSDAAIERTLNEVAKEGCQFLLDEVFLDLEVRRVSLDWTTSMFV